jgi:DDE superfamily endonuclease/Tc5 transposase-like DNA-binding protein
MPKNNREIDSMVDKALDALSKQKKPNIRKTAREFAVPEGRLRRRWKGGKTLFQRPPTNRKLDSTQEGALCEYLDYLDSVGIPLKRASVGATANSILASAHEDSTNPPPQIGEHWTRRFLKRHPEYHVRRKRAIDIERMQAVDKTVVERWFDDYRHQITIHGICPEDIYNFDETGFQIGVGKDQWIVTREPRKKIFNGSNTNRESVTVVECVSTDGFVCPPLIILSGKQVLLRWFDAIQEDEHLAVTDTGYINDQLAYQWIQYFHKWTAPRAKGAWRLLFCDRFGSHLTRQVLEFCEKVQILPFFLPAHTSHILQPLDVGVFSVYKQYHAKVVEEATMTGCQKFTKDEFLHAIASIRQKTFRPSTIAVGWKLTGLWPINSDQVTKGLIDYDPQPGSGSWSPESTPPRPGSNTSNSTEFSTPKSIQKFKRISDRIKDQEPTSSSFLRNLQKLQKGAIQQGYLLSELQREYTYLESVRSARHARYDASRRTVRITGIISSKHVKEMKRIEHKLTELESLDKIRPKWKKLMVELRRFCRVKNRKAH